MDIDDRRLAAFKALYDLGQRGTLWNVSNNVWNRVVPHFFWKRHSNGEPGMHAGLALGRRADATSLSQDFPMCIGTSKKKGVCLCVRDVFPRDKSGKHGSQTYFKIKPHPVRLEDFFGEEGRQIRPMDPKSRLADDELEQFNELLWEMGLHI